MWDYTIQLDPKAEGAISHACSLYTVALDTVARYGIYTVTEAAGYSIPIFGSDFFRTFGISLSAWCFLPWQPPKQVAETNFIESRRATLFNGVGEPWNTEARVRLAARVNLLAFEAVKRGNTNVRPFDLINFI
jgi:hypothetical protein